MKASVDTGAFDLYDPTLVPPTGIVGTAKCEAGGGAFRYKNTWVLNHVAATTKNAIFCVNGVLWKTPSQPFMIEYIAVRYLTNITTFRSSGSNVTSVSMAVEINDTGGNHSILAAPAYSVSEFLSGTNYDISTRRSLFTSVVDPGFVLNAYSLANGDQTGAIGGATASPSPIFHAYDSAWFNKDFWICFVSQPSSWDLSGTVELQILGRIFA